FPTRTLFRSCKQHKNKIGGLFKWLNSYSNLRENISRGRVSLKHWEMRQENWPGNRWSYQTKWSGLLPEIQLPTVSKMRISNSNMRNSRARLLKLKSIVCLKLPNQTMST